MEFVMCPIEEIQTPFIDKRDTPFQFRTQPHGMKLKCIRLMPPGCVIWTASRILFCSTCFIDHMTTTA